MGGVRAQTLVFLLQSADVMAQLVECVPNFSEGRSREVSDSDLNYIY